MVLLVSTLPEHMKNSPRSFILLHQTLQLVTMHSGRSRFPGWWGLIHHFQRTRFHCCWVQCRRALHHSNWRLALQMVVLGLCAAARPWKPISWSSRRTVLVLILLPEAVWNTLVSVRTKDEQCLLATLGGPVLWACVAYHFMAEPLLLLDVSTTQYSSYELSKKETALFQDPVFQR